MLYDGDDLSVALAHWLFMAVCWMAKALLFYRLVWIENEENIGITFC